MKIKKDDMVMVIAGKDKGKTGKVLAASPKTNRVVVEGCNIQTKHAKAKQNVPAEIKHIEGPIDASNVMLYDSKTKSVVKSGYAFKDGKKVRVNKKTGKEI